MHRLSAYVIVHRTQSDQTADGNRLDGERNPIGRQTQTVGGAAVSAAPTKQTGNLLQLSQLHQPSKLAIYCSCLSCTNEANRVNRTTKVNATNVGGYGILAVVTLPSAVIFSHR